MIDTTIEKDNLLERQLEKLFSDSMPSELAELFGLRLAPQAVQRKVAPRPAINVLGAIVARLPELNRQVGLGWATRSLGVLLMLSAAVIVGFALVKQVQPGHSSASVPSNTAVAIAMLGEAPSLSTPIASTAVPITPTLSADTDALAIALATFTPTAAPATLTPTPTGVPATNTPTLRAEPQAEAVTASPTPIPPTPTLAPVERVYAPTVTPVPAYATGLDAIPTPAPHVPMPERAINIVLMGSDQRPYETQWRTDVVIVVSINPDLPSVSMLSIPRDTWLYIPNWTRQRINLADVQGTLVEYPGGGPGLVKATIEYNFGIHVDYFARVNFAGLIKIVDTLGGIDVLLECPVEDGFPDDPITEDPSVVTQISYPEPGLYHIDGKHALWLSRSRKTTSEFARSRRQHRVLQGIWAKANQLGYITSLPELWEDLTATVQTDLTLEQVLWLASIGFNIDMSQVHSGFLDGRHLNAWVSPGGANVLLPQTEAILEYLEPLFNPYPYQAPQGMSQIEVWNGSGHENWGLLAADELARNGFEVVDVRKSDEVYEHSALFDFTTTSKGSPLPLLQELFDATVTHAEAISLPNLEENIQAPFRLIVGADYQPCSWPVGAGWDPSMVWPTPVPEEGGE